MPPLPSRLIFSLLLLFGHSSLVASGLFCRNLPGDPNFPSLSTWDAFNASVDGRLLSVVPSAKFCHELPAGQCNEDMWESTEFRADIPGAMDNTNWEQGNVPVYAVNATEVSHIQLGVKFASEHNLRIAVKASGHDFLGRSTAKGSLLLWTHHLQNITFTDSFVVGGKNLGSAMTVGSGVPANTLYEATKQVGKFFVGPNTATAVPAGGYVQGAGHSAFSTSLGLGADNALEFEIVIANGTLLKVNEVENSDLFFALRGGGAGSWGVVISATLQTFPTFTAVNHNIEFLITTNESAQALAEIHARHIFDWTPVGAGQYFSFFFGGSLGNAMTVSTFFPNMTEAQANASMKPFLDDVVAANLNVSVLELDVSTMSANDFMFSADDQFGINDILGSRLIPMEAYRTNVEAIGQGIKELLELGVPEILGHNLIGGKVAENADIGNAVNPKWRTAQTHLIATATWPDSVSPAGVEAIKQQMTHQLVPILVKMTNETDSGAYSNEADVREPDFQTTFFGINYPKLKSIKEKYDPNGLFIVQAGVGSEDWDTAGVCHIN
ncbi:FAD-binding domain-containing protein [Schizopora paradoxa]|uniref:FAD-binding domain-containing protein n=1 Tax=Schizopora paradoxa TaxID=27342 RepID=A0A0H2S7K6_9AGAM|nr:FAD-binding domain-containing protein [Schizopora paradoxa]